ncbi:MAG: replication-relaxation family protein [Thermoleophilia bacterium]
MSAPIRVGRVALTRFRDLFSERELSVLGSVDTYRYLTARQIETLYFSQHASTLTGARTCRRVLERLTRVGVLHRLDRRIGGLRAGSASFVYGVSPLGYRLLHDEEGPRRRRHEPSAHFLDHTLAIAQLAVDLQTAARQGVVELLTIETEPNCWRSFSRGLAGPETLKPDLALSFALGDYEHRWFVELDMGTTSAPAVVRKCRLYHDYWATGIEQDRHGLFPKVLWLTPTEARAVKVRQAVRGAAHMEQGLFEVALMAEAVTHLTESVI